MSPISSQALQYIFHKSGYHFPKTPASRQFTREITGPGILFAQGAHPCRVHRRLALTSCLDSDHSRIRKIMNPAFTAAQLKSFLPLFRASAEKVCRVCVLVSPLLMPFDRQLGLKWKDMLQSEGVSGKRINVTAWLARCTLDVIGEGTTFDSAAAYLN